MSEIQPPASAPKSHPPPDDVPLIAPCAMQARYFAPWRLLMALLFRGISYAAQSADHLRDLAAQDSVVVYVARGHSIWLALCFNYVLQRAGLPLAQFVGGVNFLWLQPLRRLWRYFKERRRKIDAPWENISDAPKQPITRREAILIDHARHGLTSYIALPIPRDSGTPDPDLGDYVRALITAQRYTHRRIFLAPHVLVDRKQSGAAHKSILDHLFGDRRRPGPLRHVAMLLTLRHGALRMADPLDLQAFLQAHPGQNDVELARLAREDLQHRMSEEERVIAGPHLTKYDATARRVLQDPQVRQVIVSQNARTGQSDLALEASAQTHLRGIAARYNVRNVSVMSHMLNLVFNRIYDGIVVDEAGLQRVVEASRRGPVVFCPAHRSHIDYLVLSYVLWQHRITPPHIAAGANLSFFPVGPLFRGCGAFFLRRSFGADPLYAAVFRAYVRDLVAQGASIEFFLEGTRSRTGKLLMPRFGILSMVVDAWRSGARDDLQFVPLSIDYERIIEASSYEKELQGAQKRSENIGGLLRTTKVLRSRYGQVQVQFGEPLSLRAMAAKANLPQSLSPEHQDAWRGEIERLGYRVLHHVAMTCSVTPTSAVCTALLGHAGRGMAQNVLLERCAGIVEYLEAAAARLSPSLQKPDTQVSAILEAVQKLVDEGTVQVDRAGRSDMEPIYRVPDEARVLLDYHKNAVMNYFAPAALIARAIVRLGDPQPRYQPVFEGTRFLSRLLKKEFLYRVDSTFPTYFDETLGALAIRGFLDVMEDGSLVLRNERALQNLSQLIDSFLQGYWITARTLLDLRADPMTRKELEARALERVRRAFLEGEISRPEAANQTLIQTALQWMTHGEIIAEVKAKKIPTLQLCDAFGPDKLQQFIDEIATYL